ncbi:hypothetical protein DOTSEDRAFT_92089 [Dothistroma septosporum NZE10]|uniref:Major facilitator superfamily (MFS) profile domain-containing protein n=1 Tax=Dothistroma septosporum (strain NZE10 / CBS 128990) TaxID=675120 RepID=M2Y0B8_DOTSN|nr:hypothetical protein DOTSEDRAFT_92089 [Dothistroma septosporum NZE10]
MALTAEPTKNTTSVEAADEATPLLGAPESGPPATENGHAHPPDSKPSANEDVEEKPMPYVQILLLCYASLAEPVAYFAIFPFINEFISIAGNIPEENVGFWSGMIESLFSLVQMVLMIFYGRLADRVGRKPVLVFSLAGVSIATALFGMAQNLGQMILFRCLAGVFAGSVVTIRTMLSENTTKATQGRAFGWYMFTRNLGIFVGPLVGGALANPARQYPGTFGHIHFFHTYPYALATFIAGAVCLSSTLTTLFFVRETLSNSGPGAAKAESMSTWEVIRAPGVAIVLYIFGHTMLLALAYTAVSPVFLFTSVEKGGFAFSPQYISYFLSLAGASQAVWMLIGFPPLQRNFGTGPLLRICAFVWPLLMVSSPLENELLRHGQTKIFWIVMPILLIIASGVSMAFACVQLCLNDISPSPHVLATVNALALTVNSAVRAVAPAVFTSLYAMGVKSGWADGHAIWFLLVALALMLNVVVRLLPEQAEGKPEQIKKTDGESEDVDGGTSR